MCCRYAHKMSERSSVELRADSQVHCDEWFAAIATEIEALRGRNSPVPALPGASTLPSSTGSPGDAAASWNQPLRAFVELPCNAACADCGAAAPRWASVTHQVIICVECAGVHRYTVPIPASAPSQLKRLAGTSAATYPSCKACSTTHGLKKTSPPSHLLLAISCSILEPLSTTFLSQF